MKLLDKYIITVVAKYMGLAIFLVLSIDLLFTFLREFKHISDSSDGALYLLYYLVLTIPKRIYRVFPMVSLLGTIMGLSALAVRSELIVMRQAGFSILSVAKPILLMALVITTFITAIGEWVLPEAEIKAANVKSFMREGKTLTTEGGYWLRDGESIIFISHVLPKGIMRGVIRYELGENFTLKEVDKVQEAQFNDGQWSLKDIESLKYQDDGSIVRSHQASSIWPSLIKPAFLSFLRYSPEELSIRGLWQYIRYLEKNELDESNYALAMWVKIFQPLATIIMIFIAIPFMFGPLRSSSMGLRMLVGIGFGSLFYMTNEMFSYIGLIYNFPPALAAILPSMIIFVIGLILLQRVNN